MCCEIHEVDTSRAYILRVNCLCCGFWVTPGMVLTDPSSWAPSPRIPPPTSLASSLETTAGIPPGSPPILRPSPATASSRSSTPAGPCSALSGA